MPTLGAMIPDTLSGTPQRSTPHASHTEPPPSIIFTRRNLTQHICPVHHSTFQQSGALVLRVRPVKADRAYSGCWARSRAPIKDPRLPEPNLTGS
jgi:hypothetical protein